MTAYANIDGHTLTGVRLHVPGAGVWWADVDFERSPDLSGAAVLSIGALRLSGTLVAAQDGTYGAQQRSRMVGGAGGWGTLLSPLHYHNDAGVRSRTVAEDAARLAGERLGSFTPEFTSVGVDYVRQAGPASRVLEDVIGASPWWVDYDGVTQVGARSTSEPDAADYEVLEYDSRERLATLTVDDLTTVVVGSVLTDGLDAPLTIRELEVVVSSDSARVMAWAGDGTGSRGRLAGLFRSLVRQAMGGRLFGKYRYRVLRMSGSRVELQAVARVAGLPDIIPVSQRPGVSGAHAKLVGGSVVLVEFVEGNPTMPIVSAFAGKDDAGHDADELDFSVTTTLRLGSAGASEGVTLGDSHKSWADGHTHGPGAFVVGSSAVTGTSGPPTSSAPAPSGKVKVDS